MSNTVLIRKKKKQNDWNCMDMLTIKPKPLFPELLPILTPLMSVTKACPIIVLLISQPSFTNICLTLYYKSTAMWLPTSRSGIFLLRLTATSEWYDQNLPQRLMIYFITNHCQKKVHSITTRKLKTQWWVDSGPKALFSLQPVTHTETHTHVHAPAHTQIIISLRYPCLNKEEKTSKGQKECIHISTTSHNLKTSL